MSSLVGQMLEHYRLVELVGQGGMATVYRALDTRSLQDVAIKVLSSTAVGDRRFVRRFRREAGFVKNTLRHPNIVGVLDYSEVRGLVYLVMPFIAGETLYDRMTRRRVSDVEAGRWIDQIAGALEFAHQQGIIHRDVKPANIIVDEAGDAHLTDFGLARMIEGSNTLTGSMLMGTPAYVAPEQGRGKRVDGRSDEYSMGVVMYQLAAGRVPFEDPDPVGLLRRVAEDPPPRKVISRAAPDTEHFEISTALTVGREGTPGRPSSAEANSAPVNCLVHRAFGLRSGSALQWSSTARRKGTAVEPPNPSS